jgi:2,4-dienoyl-CoA reductase (NADPH2)
MEAARVAAECGHTVTLFERDAQLGGAILIACRAPGWEAYDGVVRWLSGQLAKLPVDVRLSTSATVANVLAQRPDAVVIATGAEPRRPYLPGADQPHTTTVADVLAGRVKVGGRCVILDETGYTPGPKAADALSLAGHDVEIVTRQYSLGEDIGTTVRAVLHERLLRQGVTITTLTAPLDVTAHSVRVIHVLTDVEREIPADNVIFASSGVGRDQLFYALQAAAPDLELHLSGDALAPRHLRHAMVDGARIGRKL